jgi:hypothetical protein
MQDGVEPAFQQAKRQRVAAQEAAWVAELEAVQEQQKRLRQAGDHHGEFLSLSLSLAWARKVCPAVRFGCEIYGCSATSPAPGIICVVVLNCHLSVSTACAALLLLAALHYCCRGRGGRHAEGCHRHRHWQPAAVHQQCPHQVGSGCQLCSHSGWAIAFLPLLPLRCFALCLVPAAAAHCRHCCQCFMSNTCVLPSKFCVLPAAGTRTSTPTLGTPSPAASPWTASADILWTQRAGRPSSPTIRCRYFARWVAGSSSKGFLLG